jgi:CheY-like chemotaxis protein
MPYGGLPTIRVLRAEFPSLPIIAISAAEGRLQRAAQLGAVRILQKPFAFADLIPLLAETLGEKKDGDEMGAGGRNA